MHNLKYIVLENDKHEYFLIETYEREAGHVYDRENPPAIAEFSGEEKGVDVSGKEIAAVNIEIEHLYSKKLVNMVGKAMFEAGRKYERSLMEKSPVRKRRSG